MQGALYGLGLAGVEPEGTWRWWIAQPASVQQSKWDALWGNTQIEDVDSITLEIITPNEEETILSESTDHNLTDTAPRRGEDTRRDR